MPYVVGYTRRGEKVYIPVVWVKPKKKTMLNRVWRRARDADAYAAAVQERYWRLKHADPD